jgi:Fe-S-cluster-containing dehydrogenase component/formate-dependent nitrite reductase membrane component NrfD
VQYGFAIDQRTCIGCHACTVACKTEHEIPVGQFRTWVKYVDSGSYPDTTRDFGVMRCNHCTDAPCVAICPTEALFKRDDGIVDFDSERCIGCKACMQGCPYDAIYIDEDTHTAAKCNFCAHRVDEGLEPACVTVCPTHSIWVGDLDDSSSGIARLVAENPTQVRAPEQNTGPNVFYLGAEQAVLDPLAAPVDRSYLAARPDEQRLAMAAPGGIEPAGDARTTLNTAHPRPWGWRVSTYLWTKGVGAGVLLVAAAAPLARADLQQLGRWTVPGLGMGFTAATGALLVSDLKRPERFLYIFLKPNPSSWMFKGALALVAHSAVAGGWLAAEAAERLGITTPDVRDAALRVLRVLAGPSAGLAAGYTAFLFNQAEGRDLWQSRWLLPHLLAQATVAGSGALLAVAALTGADQRTGTYLARTFVGASGANLALLGAEYGRKQHTEQAQAAARLVTRGRYAKLFRRGAVGLGAVAGAVALPAWRGGRLRTAAAGGLLAQAALLCYESVFVRAGQDVPLS